MSSSREIESNLVKGRPKSVFTSNLIDQKNASMTNPAEISPTSINNTVDAPPPVVVVVTVNGGSNSSLTGPVFLSQTTPHSTPLSVLHLTSGDPGSCSPDSGDSTTQSSTSVITRNPNAVDNAEGDLESIKSSPGSENYANSPDPDLQVSHILPDNASALSSDSPDSDQAAATTTLEYGGTTIEIPDTKEGIEELCPVCGDKVSGYHYGLLTCESCKGFFKRTVQNKKRYTCVADGSCQIDKTQRKRCPFCRFQKCLDVGMKLEAVRADRMRGGRNKFGPMYKRDRARKQQLMRSRQMTQAGMMSSSRGNGAALIPPAASTTVGITYSTPYTTSPPIKEEIQSPFLSSSTSSPDSSPAPLPGPGGPLPPNGNIIAVPGGATAMIGGPELSLFVSGMQQQGTATGAAAPAPPPPSSDAGGGAASARLGFPAINSNNNGTAGGGGSGVGGGSRTPPLVRQLVQQVDDTEWQSSLHTLLQSQTYNQCEVDLFELLCKVLDQNLFSQVDWARNSIFFKDLRVDDQMKLLQNAWSDMLILDHLHQRIHNKLQDDMTLPNGQKFDLLSLALLGTTTFAERFKLLMNKLVELDFGVSDYICLKFIILLNPEIRNLNDRRSITTAHEQIKQALIDYCHSMYPEDQERYQRLMDILGELQYIADNGERFLYFKHLHGAAPTQTLLMEMLHTKRR